MRTTRRICWAAAWMIACALLSSAQGQAAAEDFEIDEAEATVITSDRLTFSQRHQYALFEDNVLVRDQNMRMRAERLTVFFDDRNQAERIEAIGRVVLQQEDTTAWARKATYDVESGTILLEGSPRIRRGRDVLEGDTITFWRFENKMVCEPRARLVLFPEEDSASMSLFGE